MDKYLVPLAILAVIVVAAGVSLCRSSSGCPLLGSFFQEPTTPSESLTTSQSNQGEPMSAVVQTKKIEHANESNFDKLVLQSNVPVLVDFYADWCGPCKALAPVLESVAQELTHAKIVKVDVDDNPGLAVRYGVEAIPTLVLFKDGQAATREVGMVSKRKLMDLLQL